MNTHMDFPIYLRQLTKEERHTLADEINIKHSYIEKLATGQGSASIQLYAMATRSKFNKHLPHGLKLYRKDEVAYRKVKANKDAA